MNKILLGLVVFIIYSLFTPLPVQASSCGISDINPTNFTFNFVSNLDQEINTGDYIIFEIRKSNPDAFVMSQLVYPDQRCESQSQCVVQSYYNLMTEEVANSSLRLIVKDRNNNLLCQNTVSFGSNPPPPIDNPTVGNPMDGVTAETFDALNPLNQFSEGVEEDLTTPGGILTRVLRFAFPIAGFILFIMLIWAGFEILSGATNGTKSVDAGKQRATAAVVGFVLLFISYFAAQLLEVVFGIQIL